MSAGTSNEVRGREDSLPATAAASLPPPAAPTGRVGRRTMGWRRRERMTGYLFLLPQLLGFLAFVLYPLIDVVWSSFREDNLLAGTSTFVGTENYETLAQDPVTPQVLGATAVFSFGLVVLNLTLALALALLLNQRLRGTTVFRTLFFSPVVVSLVAWTITWNFLLQDNGGINSILQLVGVDGPNWLRGDTTAMLSVVVVQVLKNVGLNMVLFLAALQGVPRSLLEAAEVDGAGPVRRFVSITFPMISPTTLLTAIITLAGSLQVFAQIQILTRGGPGNSTNVLVYYFYQQAFQNREFGYGSAIAVVLFVIILALTVVQWQLRKKWVFHEN